MGETTNQMLAVCKDNIEIYENNDNLAVNKGADFISNLRFIFKDDVLYLELKKANRENYILTDNLIKSLDEKKKYSSTEIAEVLNIPQSTCRGWIVELKPYLNVIEQGRYVKCDYIGLYKLRMIQMLRENNQYPVSSLKELTLGKVYTDISELNIKSEENDGQDISQDILLRLEKLEEREKETRQLVINQRKIIEGLFDKEAFSKGKLVFKSSMVAPLLEAESKKRLEAQNTLFENECNTVKDRLLDVLNGEFKKIDSYMSTVSKESIEQMILEALKENKNKSVWYKIRSIFTD
jgi:hypothetical protein